MKGKKGKGRYSFNCFASKADWVTVYKDKESFVKFVEKESEISHGN